MNVQATIEYLKGKVPLFKGFTDFRLQELVEGSRAITFEPNEAVITFGEEARFLGILMDGEAEVSVTDDSGERHLVGKLKPGELFGEMSLMSGDKTMADVIGVSRCRALLIPQNLFTAILITHPPAVTYLSRIIIERSRKVSYDETGRELAAAALKRSSDPYGFKLRTQKPMKLLVVNCGSSSLKYDLFDTTDEAQNAGGTVEKIGEEGTRHTHCTAKGKTASELPRGTHREAFAAMMEALMARGTGVLGSSGEVSAVGHRVVHGGERFSSSVVMTDEVREELEKFSVLAPLHNPINLLGMDEAQKLFPNVPHVAAFDTAFHQTMPAYAYLYGLPYECYEKKRIRRYGFHGMSHAYASLKGAEFVKRPYNELQLVICHLGNGASICAVDHGRSIDTSMGLTPAEGLIMGTRCGDIDPAVLIYLMRTEGLDHEALNELINKRSGLKGLSGVSNDMRELERAADEGHHQALLAFKTFCYRIRKYIGAYVAAMGGLDVLVFTGGIGQGSAGVRSLACQGLGYMGIHVDERRNVEARGFDGVCDLSTEGSRVRVLSVPTDEQRMIARETLRALNRFEITEIIHSQQPVPIPLEVSGHHVHLSQEQVEALFGEGHELTPTHELSQPGQFACEEKVVLVGPKGRVERVRVLGPTRKQTQVEISMTEQFKLGIAPPIRASGDLDESPGITLEGLKGAVTLDQGVICALRHIHMAPEDALKCGLRDRDRVMVRVEGERELIFGDVLVRISPSYKLAMHIDTDEANAANIKTGVTGTIDRIQKRS